MGIPTKHRLYNTDALLVASDLSVATDARRRWWNKL